MLTARELYKAGIDVLLLEQGNLGGESSWAGGGIISPLYPWRYQSSVNRIAQKSMALYSEFAAQLTDESGVDCELLGSGLLITDQTDVDQALFWSQEWGVNMQRITDKNFMHEIEPAIVETIEEGLWMPDVMQIRNPKVVKALQGSFKKLGIAYRDKTRVTDISIRSGRVSGVRSEKNFYDAEKIIVAGGAWSAGLISNIRKVDVEPVKGQMIMLKGKPNLINRIILSDGHYVIPRRDGRVLAGSTLEKTGFDKSTSDNALKQLHENAVKVVPLLADLSVERQWAGLRPGTQNGVPYICAVDGVEGLYVHAGHYRNGIVLGPASAQLMVELVLGKDPFCDPAPYTINASH